jgi:hypothetical protein
VPEALRQACARAYNLTSLNNLRKFALLRKVLTRAAEAGVPLLLLKGAGLAPWAYGDLGLRPMSDLDLLARKEDEAALGSLLTDLGGVQSWEKGEYVPGPLQQEVSERTGHAAPWYFKGVCRIEVHTHLLAGNLQDDGWLLQRLWDQAETLAWEGLSVRRLHPDHQALHLTSHLHHHVEEGLLHLYWLADLRLILAGRGPTPEAVALARALGLEEACAPMYQLAGAPWSDRPALTEPEAGAALASLLKVHLRQAEGSQRTALPYYLTALKSIQHVPGAWNKVRYVLGLFISTPAKLTHRYRIRNRWQVPFFYLADPFIRTSKVLLGLIHHVQRRLGS